MMQKRNTVVENQLSQHHCALGGRNWQCCHWIHFIRGSLDILYLLKPEYEAAPKAFLQGNYVYVFPGGFCKSDLPGSSAYSVAASAMSYELMQSLLV